MTFSAVCAVKLILKPFFLLVINTGYVVFVKPVRENHSMRSLSRNQTNSSSYV
jgi:hypothetical protein